MTRLPPVDAEEVPGFADMGILAFTTTRQAGSFGTGTDEPVREVLGRWRGLQAGLAPAAPRLATAVQVHGDRVLLHVGGWEGWLRSPDADGHATAVRGTAMAVTVADCVPVFLAHSSGIAAVLHSGWRGTEARIIERGLHALAGLGAVTSEVRVHLGPAICGSCYEVSPDVHQRLTGRTVERPTPVDLRAIIAGHAHALGVRDVTLSPWCTRCHNARFFSHRAGDAGRQLGVLAIP